MKHRIHRVFAGFFSFLLVASLLFCIPTKVSATLNGTTIISLSNNKLNQIAVVWEMSEDATGYEISYATAETFANEQLAAITSKDITSHTLTGLTSGATYFVRVRVVSEEEKSAWSPIRSVKNAVILAPKVSNVATVTEKSIRISWKKAEGAAGYYIYRKNSSAAYRKIATIRTGKTTIYTDKAVKGSYTYVVKAYRIVQGKRYISSASADIRTKTLKPSSAPKLSNAAGDEKQLAVKARWKKVNGANRYALYYKLGKKGKWEKADTTDKTSFQLNVKHGKRYYYKVRTMHKMGNTISYGPYSEVKSFVRYYKPNYSVFLSSKTDKEAYAVVAVISNNGIGTMRIYSKGSAMIDVDNQKHNRSLYLVDERALNKGKVKKISYVDIKPGKSKTICFAVQGDSTRYDAKSYLCFSFRHDGVMWMNYSSSSYGSEYDFEKIVVK